MFNARPFSRASLALIVASLSAVLTLPAEAQRVKTGRFILGDFPEGNVSTISRVIELVVPCQPSCRYRFSLASATGEPLQNAKLTGANAGVFSAADGTVTFSGERSIPYEFSLGLGILADTIPEPDEVVQVRVEDLLQPKTADGYPTYYLYGGKILNDDIDFDSLAARGAALAESDARSAAVSTRFGEGPQLRAFHIGLAAAEGQTAWGPGKQKMRDALPQDERAAFETAVTFSINRNSYAPRAELGATIAEADEAVKAVRSNEPDPLYQLGFDIATAIFGDKALGAQGNTATGPGSLGIRNSLSDDAKWGFDAAVKFHLSRGSGGTSTSYSAFAARGNELANADPLALELRSRQNAAGGQRGFDIAMGAAEGQTAPGPGKQRIRDSLPLAEQAGFDAALLYTLDRNRYADRAAIGAAIAEADPVVAQARTADPNVLFWLGFDIASAIFGDPALGAQGNTATGPGSLGIRNTLSPAAQRGFDASVKLHLSRKYR